jgi:hypothetical protein
MRTAINQIERGEGRDADEFFDELRSQLATMKRAKRPPQR